MARARDGSDGCPQLSAHSATPAAVRGSAAARPAVDKRNRSRATAGDSGFCPFRLYACACISICVCSSTQQFGVIRICDYQPTGCVVFTFKMCQREVEREIQGQCVCQYSTKCTVWVCSCAQHGRSRTILGHDSILCRLWGACHRSNISSPPFCSLLLSLCTVSPAPALTACSGCCCSCASCPPLDRGYMRCEWTCDMAANMADGGGCLFGSRYTLEEVVGCELQLRSGLGTVLVRAPRDARTAPVLVALPFASRCWIHMPDELARDGKRGFFAVGTHVLRRRGGFRHPASANHITALRYQ